ncbi:centromere protein S [Theristicus caerulescens]
MAAARPRPTALGGKPGRAAEGRAMEAAGGEERLLLTQRLKAAVHYTVGCLCQDVAEDKEMQFSKQTIAAISEITFRQCENFAKDLEMFARHAKRSTVTTEDVKLLARRSNSLLKYITQKSEEIASSNMEQKEKKKKKSMATKGGITSGEQEAAVTESEDSNMA